VHASTSQNACWFFSLIAFLRVLTVSLSIILTEGLSITLNPTKEAELPISRLWLVRGKCHDGDSTIMVVSFGQEGNWATADTHQQEGLESLNDNTDILITAGVLTEKPRQALHEQQLVRTIQARSCTASCKISSKVFGLVERCKYYAIWTLTEVRLDSLFSFPLSRRC
jgi:hypothetical protein